MRAHRAWLTLYREPDVWRQPEKRRRMLRARLAYQDAAVLYVFAFRPAPERSP